MQTMERATVISLAGRRERGRRMARAIDMRRTLEEVDRRAQVRTGGRAWVNGQELGGRRETLDHLGQTHD
jgi:hypothetical protein